MYETAIQHDNTNLIVAWCGLVFTPTFFGTLLFAINYSTIKTKKHTDSIAYAHDIKFRRKSQKNGSTYTPIFYFSVDDKEYIHTSSYASNYILSLKENEIYYNSQDPNICISKYELYSCSMMSSIYISYCSNDDSRAYHTFYSVLLAISAFKFTS